MEVVSLAQVAVDERSRAQLTALAAAPPTGNVVVIASSHGDVARSAAWAWALEVAGGMGPDVTLAVPEGDRWTVLELDDLVRRPASRVPMTGRNVIVVDRATSMDPAAADRLLKTLEEPAAPTWFVLAVDALDELRPTVRGRVAASVVVGLAPARERAAALLASGVSSEAAIVSVEASGFVVSVLQAAAENEELAPLLVEASQVPLRSSVPVVDGVRLSELLDAAGKACGGPAPVVKGQVRALARWMLWRWRGELSAALADGSISTDAAAAVLGLLDEAHGWLAAYLSPRVVLAATLSGAYRHLDASRGV